MKFDTVPSVLLTIELPLIHSGGRGDEREARSETCHRYGEVYQGLPHLKRIGRWDEGVASMSPPSSSPGRPKGKASRISL